MSLITRTQQICGKVELLIIDFTCGLPIFFVDEWLRFLFVAMNVKDSQSAFG